MAPPPDRRYPRPSAPYGQRSHRPPEARAAREGASRRFHEEGEVLLYGIHPVVEALRNPRRRIVRLVATENGARRLQEAVPDLDVEPVLARPDEIGRQLTADAVHQGVLLVCEPLPSPALAELGEARLVLALDQITDPHNVGAILRTAAAFAVDAVVTTERHAPAATGVLAKAASGGLEHVPIASVRNLGDALTELKEAGLHIVGLDSDGDEDFAAIELQAPLVLVLGAEGKGLRQRTRSLCDRVARIDVPGVVRSLNVSNAAAVALHVADRALRRPA